MIIGQLSLDPARFTSLNGKCRWRRDAAIFMTLCIEALSHEGLCMNGNKLSFLNASTSASVLLAFLLASPDAVYAGWHPERLPVGDHAISIGAMSFPTPTEGWAVGLDTTIGTAVVLCYSRGNWTLPDQPPFNPSFGNSLSGVFFTSPDAGWAVGMEANRPCMLRYSQGNWTKETLIDLVPDTGGMLKDVFFPTATEGWAIGETYSASGSAGILLHYSDGSWRNISLSSIGGGQGLNKLSFPTANEGWAVGSDGDKVLLLHYQHGNWSKAPPPSVSPSMPDLTDISFPAITDGWAVGFGYSGPVGILLHYRDDHWLNETPLSINAPWSLRGVAFPIAAEGWVVGTEGDLWSSSSEVKGLLLHYQNGTWRSLPSPVDEKHWGLWGVHFTSADEGWAWGGGPGLQYVFLHYLKSTTPPPAATLVSPAATISTSTPAYIWRAVEDASDYCLQIDDSTGTRIRQWYTAAQSGCDTGSGICSVIPPIALAAGACKWWILTRNEFGDGPWSDGLSFTFDPLSPPGKAALVSPHDSVQTNMPVYTWNAVPGAIYYQLWVNDSRVYGKIQQLWYTSVEAKCAAGIGACSVIPDVSLASGQAKWWIQTWNLGGYGPWSEPTDFQVAVNGPPGKACPAFPQRVDRSNPTFIWYAAPTATWYCLSVVNASGTINTRTWYRASETGCAADEEKCAVTPAAVLSGEIQWSIQTWNSFGYGPWSDIQDFLVVDFPPRPLPGIVTLVSPVASITNSTPTYAWQRDSVASWYYLWVNDSSGAPRIRQWFSVSQAGCAPGVNVDAPCSVMPTVTLPAGTYQWWIQTWDAGSYGPWSLPLQFTVVGGIPQ